VGLLLRSQFEDPQYDLDPNQMNEDDPAEMNMAFFLYVIKDVLEHVGFQGDSSKFGAKMAARDLRMALAKFELLTQKAQHLSKVLTILEQE
jgi:hypothetical protein